MSEIEHIIDELKEVHNGEAWHGPALKELLAEINAEQAAARPFGRAHSIWEIVRHITVWEKVVRLRLEGQAVAEPEEGDFPEATGPSPAAWSEAIAALDREHEQLMKAMAGLQDSDLQRPVAGKDYSTAVMLNGSVRHHVYHSGQIALLRRICQAANIS